MSTTKCISSKMQWITTIFYHKNALCNI